MISCFCILRSFHEMCIWGRKRKHCVFVYLDVLAYLCVCQIPLLDGFVPPLREEARSYTSKLSNLRTTFVSDKQEKDDAWKQREWWYGDEEDAENIVNICICICICIVWSNLRRRSTLLHTHSWVVHGVQPLKRPEVEIIHSRVHKKPRRSSTASVETKII